MFAKKKKMALDEAVLRTGLPASRIIVDAPTPGDSGAPPRSSRFGGAPYFEAGDTWPVWRGDRPYDFICQINLRECPVRPDVAFDLFTVFVSWAAVDQFEDDDVCVVRTYKQADDSRYVEVARPLHHDEDDYRIRECGIHFTDSITYPWERDSDPDVEKAASAFFNPAQAYENSLNRLGFSRRFQQGRRPPVLGARHTLFSTAPPHS